MLLLRKIIFYIFAVIYLVLCPLIVARMLGFVINPLTHHLEKTGLVYVSTNPPDATVYIDGRRAHQKTPTAIRDLAPGKHFIRIEHSGYNDWEMNIPIVGKKATVLANTLLIPQEWPIKRISDRPFQNITPAADDMLIAVSATHHFQINLKENPPLIKEVSNDLLNARASFPAPEVFLINDNKDLLTKKGKWVQLRIKEDFGGLQAYDITSSKPGTKMYFDEKSGELFYLDEAGFLSEIQILPVHPIVDIPIPEALRFKTSNKEPNL